MGSRRLPGKVLEKVGSKTLLEGMVNRLSRCQTVDEILIATTFLPEDRAIIDHAKGLGVSTFVGSSQDVLDRYYFAARNRNLDVVVRLTSDCPLVDPEVVDEIIGLFQAGNFDFCSNSEPLPTSWPDGMDVSVFSIKALERAWQGATLPSHREHVTFYFWQSGDFSCHSVPLAEDYSNFRFTVDYPEDLEFLRRLNLLSIASHGRVLGELTMWELLELCKSNPEVMNLNSMYSRGLGWLPSLDADKFESGE